MATATKKGEVSKEQIATWKKEHKEVYVITVTTSDGETLIGYLKKPTRNIKATAMSMYSQHKVLESGEFLRDNCWLDGDERLKTMEDVADSAAIQASGIVKFLEGSLGLA